MAADEETTLADGTNTEEQSYQPKLSPEEARAQIEQVMRGEAFNQMEHDTYIWPLGEADPLGIADEPEEPEERELTNRSGGFFGEFLAVIF